jgi:glutaredoxin
MCALVGLSGPALAEIFSWRDADGRVQFGDRKPADAPVTTVKIRAVNSLRAVSVEACDAAATQVILYSASWCGYCKKARAYFKQEAIPFEEYDIETSDRGRLDYAQLNGRGVPIILFGKQRMNGFDATQFAALYKKS